MAKTSSPSATPPGRKTRSKDIAAAEQITSHFIVPVNLALVCTFCRLACMGFGKPQTFCGICKRGVHPGGVHRDKKIVCSRDHPTWGWVCTPCCKGTHPLCAQFAFLIVYCAGERKDEDGRSLEAFESEPDAEEEEEEEPPKALPDKCGKCLHFKITHVVSVFICVCYARADKSLHVDGGRASAVAPNRRSN